MGIRIDHHGGDHLQQIGPVFLGVAALTQRLAGGCGERLRCSIQKNDREFAE